ncbi:MAG TPA: hypothetical protein VMA30_17920 [Xanthobacteraceae bacterium]|nr:hypothetical protein [Xanthobacteraceae bacterium]
MVQVLDENALWIFVLVSIVLGGGAAALAGRAIAKTWRPVWQVVGYGFVLGIGVRFIHFSVFNGTLLSLHYYLVDSAVCIAFGLLGFRAARAAQMVTQYNWLIAPARFLRWRRRQL